MAFLDGAPPERLCQPIVEYITGVLVGAGGWGGVGGSIDAWQTEHGHAC